MKIETECICTVLMIAYNHEKYIRLALESVVMQETEYKYKVHVFDDASTDGTGDIIKEYVARYPDLIIPFISEKNRGAQANIWAAYNSVDTRYCAFLECDDYWCDKEKLQLQIDALENNPDCSYCAHNTIYQNEDDEYRTKENGKIFVYNSNVRDTGIYGPEDFLPLNRAGWVNHCNSRVIRMSCVDLNGLEEKEDFLYDNAQFFYLLKRGNVYFIERVMSVYNMNMASTFTSMDVQRKIREHGKRMLHINESTGRQFERLIYRHLSSFTKYWLDRENKTVKKHSSLIYLIMEKVKKNRYDFVLHRKLRKDAKKKIIELLKAVEE